MQQATSIYVEIGSKGSYKLAIRYPALVFGGAHFRITSDESAPLTSEKIEQVFGLEVPTPVSNKTYISFDYNLYASTRMKVQTKLIDRNSLAYDLTGVKLLYNQFLDFLESKSVLIDRDAAIGVYIDTLMIELKNTVGLVKKPSYIEPLSVEVGGFSFKLGE